MSQRFDAAAKNWDGSNTRQQLAESIYTTIMTHQPLKPSDRIMDFGAGTGLVSYKIASHVAHVAAVDLSEKMLETLASKNDETHSISMHLQDIVHIPLQERFDGIVSAMAMHHVADTRALLESFYQHLEPGGFIAIGDLDEEDGTFHEHGNEGVHHFGFNQDKLKAVAQTVGFKDVVFHHAHSIDKAARSFDVFVMQAHKPL